MSGPKAPAEQFTVLYFATATSYTGREYDFFDAPQSLEQLHDSLEKKYPGIRVKVLESCALTVNLDYVDLEDAIEVKAGDEVGIIPPVSSG